MRERFESYGRVEGDVAFVPLSAALLVRIDLVDLERVLSHSWSPHPRSDGPYARAGVDARRVSLHRWLIDARPGDIVDHIDGDPLNCTRANLRLCTVAENNRNVRGQRGSASRFKGVWRRRDRDGWYAEIDHDGTTYRLGLFPTEIEAALAYDAAARELHGEFARLNVPEAAR